MLKFSLPQWGNSLFGTRACACVWVWLAFFQKQLFLSFNWTSIKIFVFTFIIIFCLLVVFNIFPVRWITFCTFDIYVHTYKHVQTYTYIYECIDICILAETDLYTLLINSLYRDKCVVCDLRDCGNTHTHIHMYLLTIIFCLFFGCIIFKHLASTAIQMKWLIIEVSKTVQWGEQIHKR